MLQKIVLSIVLFFAFSIVAFFLLIKVIDFNEYKPRLQKLIKENTGYELMIKGDITLSLSPVGISVFDIEVLNPHDKEKGAFAKLKSFDVAVEIAPLLKKEIKIRHVAFDTLVLSIEKMKNDQYNFELPLVDTGVSEKKVAEPHSSLEEEIAFPLVNVKKVKFINANIQYSEVKENTKLLLENINFEVNDIRYDASKHRLQGLSFVANTTMDKLQYAQYALRDISMALEMKEAILTSENVKYTLFSTPSEGSVKIDLSGKQPKISLKSKIEGLKLEELSKELFQKELLGGKANGDVKLSFFLGDTLTFKSTVNGFVQLYGENVVLKGYDIDTVANTLSSTKGLPNIFVGGLTSTQNSQSLLKVINAKVDIGYSEIQLSDVALSTSKHRIALKGTLNIVEEKFKNFRVALLDAKGCARFEQKIEGTFQKPVVKLEDVAIKTLSNVALSLLNKSKGSKQENSHTAENCVIFYEGVVKHP
ncbi:AsmA family protein [Sulfurospirillum barnesii]|uniref:Uncharacterized protein involved in outer membrane biogenesis n=1 Tax=Sulfurospirillum barnesii (strain ATCC 700032 / DSM 10660 / SES-3) TaxID=760154 RepID=I3XYT6_SULBS|nr:AsmA family protein [Sulfurospirillum barnesii]AFL69110.1 uncharacterized protein involved in outer membrane biogenesis [Sulfurospirillum barnesii SES-3]